jgi:short-subunit dehydrogenase
MRDWLAQLFEGRPWWMNALMVFSGFMAIVYVPWDIFVKPAAIDEEVWFGIRFYGGTAKFLALFHWAIYAGMAYGFRRMRPWLWPWAAVYWGQVAFGMLVWSWVYIGGFGGFLLGLASFAPFGWLTAALWNARPQFQGERQRLRERYGEWAVVTGASAGIGAEFARQLARDGMSVVLAARREDRLRELAADIEREHPVKTRVVAADLSRPEQVDALADAVRDLDVALLVNNAGFGYQGRFDRQDQGRLLEMVALNCAAPVHLTHRLLPQLTSRYGRSAVIVTGSVAGRQPLPLHAVYAATKAFDLLFGEALSVELRDRGVDVLVLEPGPTDTEFQAEAGEIPHHGEPVADVVRTALDALGRQPSVVSGWWNWLRANLATRLGPRPLVAYAARDLMLQQTPPEMR